MGRFIRVTVEHMRAPGLLQEFDQWVPTVEHERPRRTTIEDARGRGPYCIVCGAYPAPHGPGGRLRMGCDVAMHAAWNAKWRHNFEESYAQDLAERSEDLKGTPQQYDLTRPSDDPPF